MKMCGFQGKKGQKVPPIFAPNITMEFHYHAFCAAEIYEQAAQRASFGAGHPADVHVDIPADSGGKNFGQALEILEKQACRCRRP